MKRGGNSTDVAPTDERIEVQIVDAVCFEVPPPHCPNMGQVLVQQGKVRKDPQMSVSRPAYPPAHKSTCNCGCTNTLTPVLTLPAACTKLETEVCKW